jgi:UDP-glucose 4-epimerase
VRILVTGAAGKLGTAVVEHLLEEGHTVVAVDRLPTETLTVPVHLFDLRDRSGLPNLLDGVDAVVHAATTPYRAGASPAEVMENNVGATLNLVEASRRAEIKTFVYVSSIQVIASEEGKQYGPARVAYLPLDGESPVDPRGAYSCSKAAGETIVRTLQDSSGVQCYALRFPWLVSASGDSAAGHPLKPPWRREKRVLVEQGFSFLSFGDAARLVLACLNARLTGYQTFLPALSTVPRSLLPRYLRRYYKDVPLRIPAREMRSLVDISSIERETGWTPLDLPRPFSHGKGRR